MFDLMSSNSRFFTDLSLFSSSSFVFSIFSSAQVAIGKAEITKLSDNTTPNPGISLEFGTGNKGIVLPWVTSAAAVTGAVDGTVMYDLSDYKIKYKKETVSNA